VLVQSYLLEKAPTIGDWCPFLDVDTYHSGCVNNVRSKMNFTESNCFVVGALNCRIIAVKLEVDGGYVVRGRSVQHG
jgi:hypothetical protein